MPRHWRRGGAAQARRPAWVSGALLFLIVSTPTHQAAAQAACTACHANREFLVGLVGDSTRAAGLTLDPDRFGESVHGRMGFTCTLCHTDLGDFPHGTVAPVNCGMCHRAELAQVESSVHGRVHPEPGIAPATCADCHTDHHILGPTDPRSSVYRLTQFEICATCHSDPREMRLFGHEKVEAVGSYLSSVHGRGLLAKGLSVAPVCTDCHGELGTGAHQIQAVADSACPMNRQHVVETCGRCHAGIMAQYDRGIHGHMFREGNADVPTCVDCHGEHAVAPVTSPASGVSPRHVTQTCTSCHDREDLNDRYGLATGRGTTFRQSFHGVALESGQFTVAHCESCHGAHEILPSSDPRSTIHPDNLAATCGHCHSGIGAGVVRGKIHVASLTGTANTLSRAVQWFYFVIIGGFVVYSLAMIALDQYRHWVVDRQRRAHG